MSDQQAAIRQKAIELICIEADELGYCEEDIADFREGKFDGDDLLTLQAVERALDATPIPSSEGELLSELEKLRDRYKSQMKFCDIEPLPYFRDFASQLEVIISKAGKAKSCDGAETIEAFVDLCDFSKTMFAVWEKMPGGGTRCTCMPAPKPKNWRKILEAS